MERDVLIGHVGGESGRTGRRLVMSSPLRFLLETGAVRHVRLVSEAVVAQGRSWFEPLAG